MGETEEFNTLVFEKKLMQLKDTQESIQNLSSWCLKQREHHKKIVASWLNVLKRVKVEQRLTLFYLANDVIQYSKRKNYQFVESWGLNLQKATPLVRDEKVRPKILRILKIWEQRGVYDDEFLSDLTGLLSSGVVKKTDNEDPLDFQPQQLVNKIRQCSDLETDTDLRLAHIHECPLPLHDAEALCTTMKDRGASHDAEKELNEGIQCMERYTQALQREIVAREALLALLASANQYYATQRGEVKVVAYAYKNFGSRVRALKRKLDELTTKLPVRTAAHSLSPSPSPPHRDEDVPSPGPDEDLDLPNAPGLSPPQDDELAYNIDRTFNTSMSADGSLYNLGLSSFLTTDNPLAMFDHTDVNSSNKIEVINSRPSEKQDFDINNFLKTLIPNDSDSAVNINSGAEGDCLPGLDLLSAPPPPPSFYGAIDSGDEPEPYLPEPRPQWTNQSWSLSHVPQPVPPVVSETPESPPPALPAPPPPPPLVPLVPYSPVTHTELASTDVDHRGLLPPPPPPPVLPLLTSIEDVDHRLLPSLQPPPAAPRPPPPHTVSDVDHRNLISLTHMPRNHAPPTTDVDQEDLWALLIQDYRVPTGVPAPSDIVESVDMDLSEDESNHDPRLYDGRRAAASNNRVLVGGNGTLGNEQSSALIVNPFDKMPNAHSNYNAPPFQNNYPAPPPDYNREYDDNKQEDSNDSAYEEDLRSRGMDQMPQHGDDFNADWRERPFGQRLPRWGPVRGGPRGVWPRGPVPGPRGPPRWPGPRIQRFW